MLSFRYICTAKRKEKKRKGSSQKTKIECACEKRRNVPKTGAIKKPYRNRPAVVALREIRRYQKSTDQLIRKLSFQWSVSDITQQVTTVIHFTAKLMEALQEATETYLVGLFEDTKFMCNSFKLITIMPKDIHFVRHLCGERTWKHYPEKQLGPFRTINF